MSAIHEKITSALGKLGPSAPKAVAREINEHPSNVGYHLRALAAKKLITAAGKGRGITYSLASGGDSIAPPQTSKPRRKKKHGKPAPAARPAERFIPAVDVDSRLVLINGTEPQIFTEAQTEAIATLLLRHYSA